MFFIPELLKRQGTYFPVWIAATQQTSTLNKYLPPRKVREIRLHVVVEEILKTFIESYPSVPRSRLTHFSLYLSSKLLFGSCIVLQKQATILFSDISDVYKNIKLTRWSTEKNMLVVQTTTKKTKPHSSKHPGARDVAEDEEVVNWAVVAVSDISVLNIDDDNPSLTFSNSVPAASITLMEDCHFSPQAEDLRFGDEDVERHPVYALPISDIYGLSRPQITEITDHETNVRTGEVSVDNLDFTRRDHDDHVNPFVLYGDDAHIGDRDRQNFQSDLADSQPQPEIQFTDLDSRPIASFRHDESHTGLTSEQTGEMIMQDNIDTGFIPVHPSQNVSASLLDSLNIGQTSEAITSVLPPCEETTLPHGNEISHSFIQTGETGSAAVLQDKTLSGLFTGPLVESQLLSAVPPQDEIHTDPGQIGELGTPPHDEYQPDLTTEHVTTPQRATFSVNELVDELPDLEETPRRTRKRKGFTIDREITIPGVEIQRRMSTGALDTLRKRMVFDDDNVIERGGSLTQPGRKLGRGLISLVRRNFRTHPMPTIDLRNPLPIIRMQSPVHERHNVETENLPENISPELMTHESPRKRRAEENKRKPKTSTAKRPKPSQGMLVEQLDAEEGRDRPLEDLITQDTSHHRSMQIDTTMADTNNDNVEQQMQMIFESPQSRQLETSVLEGHRTLEHEEVRQPETNMSGDVGLLNENILDEQFGPIQEDPMIDQSRRPETNVSGILDVNIFGREQGEEHPTSSQSRQPETNVLQDSGMLDNANLFDRELGLGGEHPTSPHQSGQPETALLSPTVPEAEQFSPTPPSPPMLDEDVLAQIDLLTEEADQNTILMDVLCPRVTTRRRKAGKTFYSLLALQLNEKIQLSQQRDGVTISSLKISKLN